MKKKSTLLAALILSSLVTLPAFSLQAQEKGQSIVDPLSPAPSLNPALDSNNLLDGKKIKLKWNEEPTLSADTEKQANANLQSLIESLGKESNPPIEGSKIDQEKNLFSKEDNLLTKEKKEESNLLGLGKKEESMPWLKMALSTLFLLSGIVMVAWYSSRKLKGQNVFGKIQSSSKNSLQLIQRLSLAPRTELIVVEWESKKLLLSLQNAQVHLLQELKETELENQNLLSSIKKEEVRKLELLQELQAPPLSTSEIPVESKEKWAEKIKKMVKELKPLPHQKNQAGSEKNKKGESITAVA